jgi:cell division protein FtsQ
MATATDLEPRLEARGRARRRARLATTLTVFVLVLLVAAGGWLLLGTSALGVHTVTVTGTDRLDPGTVREVAAVPVGAPLATLDAGAIAARLEALPVVRSVEVDRRWPRTVSIVVHERVPAAVRQRGTTYALVDRSGVELDQVDERPRGLPLVSAPVDAGAPALRAALDVLDVLPPAVAADVRSVRAATPDDVRLQLSKGRTVVWGSAERSARKAAVLAVLLTRKAGVYDVSAPDAPTTTK